VPITRSTPFVVSEDEGDTKEGPSKSMKNALYVQRHGKRHLSVENYIICPTCSVTVPRLSYLEAQLSGAVLLLLIDTESPEHTSQDTDFSSKKYIAI